MSKLEQLRALREAKFIEPPKPKWRRPGRPKGATTGYVTRVTEPVTKLPSVTECVTKSGEALSSTGGKSNAVASEPHRALVLDSPGGRLNCTPAAGRPRIYPDAAAKQRAYRKRKANG